jgi:pteridine reductase
MSLRGKTILITGAARRVGRALALSVARAGANVIIHHANSPVEAQQVAEEIQQAGGQAWVIQADFHFPEQVEGLVTRVNGLSKLYAIVNNASIFDPLEWKDTSLDDWQRHMNINLTAPFLLSRDFAAQLAPGEKGRIVNILDWRALRPAGDHLPYTISKSALAALTYSMAAALAPNVTVNGLALGAILPPSGSKADDFWLGETPIHRWGKLEEVGESLLFLLDGPEYITGEIIYVDGGRHLV